MTMPRPPTYGIGKAEHGALLPVDLFELTQDVRQEKASESPNRVGRPRSYSVSRCGRVNILQGTLLCGICGHAMAPHYTYKKAGEKRRTEKFIHYYTCAQQVKRTKESGHCNRVRAEVCESWVFDTVDEVLSSPVVVERALQRFQNELAQQAQPHQEALALTKQAIQANHEQVDGLLTTIQTSQVPGALLTMLNEKAESLLKERDLLQAEHRRLVQKWTPPQVTFNSSLFCERLADFRKLTTVATPEELQRLMQLLVRRIHWMPDGEHRIQFNYLPKTKSCEPQGFATNVHFGSPWRRSCEPLALQVVRHITRGIFPESVRLLIC